MVDGAGDRGWAGACDAVVWVFWFVFSFCKYLMAAFVLCRQKLRLGSVISEV